MTVEHHKRVLVVDDDADIRGILTAVLRQRGLVVDEASDGMQALQLVRENRYSVMLLDLFLPITDGFSVLESIRVDEPAAAPVVLVVTGADRGSIDRLDPRLIHGVVKKPFDPHELASIVVACAEIRGRSAFETMAIAMLAGSPLLALLSSKI